MASLDDGQFKTVQFVFPIGNHWQMIMLIVLLSNISSKTIKPFSERTFSKAKCRVQFYYVPPPHKRMCEINTIIYQDSNK